jgi:hypothetical protein
MSISDGTVVGLNIEIYLCHLDPAAAFRHTVLDTVR